MKYDVAHSAFQPVLAGKFISFIFDTDGIRELVCSGFVNREHYGKQNLAQ